jgi:hypothetical protein
MYAAETKIPFPVVMEAARSWALAEEHPFELPEARMRISVKLYGKSLSYWTYVNTQIYHALDKLAAEGALVKVGKDQLRPEGILAGRHPWYYTPGAFKAARGAHVRDMQDQERRAERWGRVYDQLTDVGLPPENGRGHDIALSIAQWEQLLGI